MNSTQDLFRQIPAIDALLQEEPVQRWLAEYKSEFIIKLLRRSVQQIRETIRSSAADAFNKEDLTKQIIHLTEAELTAFFNSKLKCVVNGTGVVLHTNLGRAPLAPEVRHKLNDLAENYCSVEYAFETGKRGERNGIVEHLITALSGAEAAAVVNNNAAAVLLALNSIANGKEVLLSRGQLIEIGGSFRIPEVMAQSGAKMIEVGTTNKTHLRDYENAVTEDTGAILVVHPSNYRVLGFVQEVPLEKLVRLAHKHAVPVIYDLGGGVFVDLEKYGLPHEPVVSDNVKLGVDVITFSGDKVLGGPQSGLIVGRKKYIRKIRENHLLRALRLDKLIFAALEETLKLYFKRDFEQKIPALRMLMEPMNSQKKRGEALLSQLPDAIFDSGTIDLTTGTSQVGSGAIPLEEIESYVLTLSHNSLSANQLAGLFRKNSYPVIGYIRRGKFTLNLRTIKESELPILKDAISSIFTE